jgi:hypothetical protein
MRHSCHIMFQLSNLPNRRIFEWKLAEDLALQVHELIEFVLVGMDMKPSITYGQIKELIDSMHTRCKAVIEAGGWYTK